MTPLRIRATPNFHALLDQVSQTNISGAMKALALIGAAQVGLDMTGCQREVALALLTEDLAPTVRAALTRLTVGEAVSVLPLPSSNLSPDLPLKDTCPTPDLPALAAATSDTDTDAPDPFDAIGIQV